MDVALFVVLMLMLLELVALIVLTIENYRYHKRTDDQLVDEMIERIREMRNRRDDLQ